MKRLLLILSVIAVAAGWSSAEAARYVYANGFAKNDMVSGVIADEWIRRIEKGTEGRIKIRHVAGGALLKAEEMLEGLRKGVTNFGSVTCGYHIGELPIAAQLAGALDVEVGNKLDLSGISAITMKLFDEIPEFRQEFTKMGIKPLVWVPPSPFSIITQDPIRTIEDFKGRKIRGFGDSLPKLLNSLGAVPMAIAFGEIYTSVQTGVIEGTITGPTAMISSGVYEVAKNVITTGPELGTPVALATTAYSVNLDTWNKLTAADRDTIDKLSRQMTADGAVMMTKATLDAYAKMKAAGVAIHHLSVQDTARMAKMIPPFFDVAAQTLNDKGLPGTKVFNRYRELADAYASGELKP